MMAIEHITLNTGAARMSPRSEINPGVIADLRLKIMAGARFDQYWALSDLTKYPHGGVTYVLSYRDRLILRSFLCLSKDDFDAMWGDAQSCVDDDHIITRRPRGAVWLADYVIVAPPLDDLTRAALTESGDLSRCIAWAMA